MKRRNFIGNALLGLAGSALNRKRTVARDRRSYANTDECFQLSKTIPPDPQYDLVVVGGGMAGVSAAIAAGRLGARVLLVEAMGNLGGMGTSGLVTAFDGMGDGERMLVGGVMREIVEEMYTRKHMPDTPCCTASMAREIMRIPEMLWVAFQEGGIGICLYSGAHFTQTINDGNGILDEAAWGLSFYMDNQYENGAVPLGRINECDARKQNIEGDKQAPFPPYGVLPPMRTSTPTFAAVAAQFARCIRTSIENYKQTCLRGSSKMPTSGWRGSTSVLTV